MTLSMLDLQTVVFVVQPNESVIILIEQQIIKGLVNSVGTKFRLIQVKIPMTGH